MSFLRAVFQLRSIEILRKQTYVCIVIHKNTDYINAQLHGDKIRR
jgi:hypothetical protein